ncbi:MAG: hypothetical protein RIR97_94 [Pseudomonadota bacterium]
MTSGVVKKIPAFLIAAAVLAALMAYVLPDQRSSAAPVSPPVATEARIAGDDARTRIVIDFESAPTISVHYLHNPERIIVDLNDSKFNFPASQLQPLGLYSDIRFGTMTPGMSRIVLTLKRPARLTTAEVQGNESGTGYRLVLDGEMTDEATFADLVKSQVWQKTDKSDVNAEAVAKNDSETSEQFIVAVDAGHGGIDAGATGIDSKTQEKEITLDYAKAFVDLLNAEPGIHAFLTRDRDIFLSLSERVTLARQKKANLFVSIHADTLPQKDIRGATIYTISDKASDNLAENLARRENKSDEIAGVPLENEPAEVADILIDLARRETQAFSISLADVIVKSFEGEINLINNPRRAAGFRVLMAPDVPSVLIELGFLSNRDDEAQLINPEFRKKVAARLTEAVRVYRDKQGRKNG